MNVLRIQEMLWFFKKGERIGNNFLLRKRFTQDEIDYANANGYIYEVENNILDASTNDVKTKYVISEKGIKLRDSHL